MKSQTRQRNVSNYLFEATGTNTIMPLGSSRDAGGDPAQNRGAVAGRKRHAQGCVHDLPRQGTEVQGAIWPRPARRILNMMTGAACNCLTIFFHRMKSAPGGEKLLLITFPGKLQEIQQAVSGRGRTCPASPQDPELKTCLVVPRSQRA